MFVDLQDFNCIFRFVTNCSDFLEKFTTKLLK